MAVIPRREGVTDMTRDEADRIEKLTAVVSEVITEMRVANARNSLEISHIKDTCEERHSDSRMKVAQLQESDRQSFGFRQRLSGMGVPIGLLVAVGLGVLNLVK